MFVPLLAQIFVPSKKGSETGAWAGMLDALQDGNKHALVTQMTLNENANG